MKNCSYMGTVARLGMLLWAFGLIASAGCTRDFYRKQADKEVNDILAEKDKYPQWKIEQYHVYPDPRSRFTDTFDPDHPPMPPDDPAAWDLSPHSQHPNRYGTGDNWGTGYLEMIKTWDTQNREERKVEAEKTKSAALGGGADQLENRTGEVKALFDELFSTQGFLLKLDQSIELGVINSPTYQSFREQLYEAALPVTQQRFSFAFQWAAIEDDVRNWGGPLSPTGEQNNWNLGSSVGFSKLFSTGALLTMSFANQTVYNFAGGAGFTSSSTINLSAVQPLLQGGGKAVTLEPLNQAERNLVYSIRAYARFREEFYVGVALGTTLPSSLPALASVTSTASSISVLQAIGIASTDVSGGFVGYLSTLFRECDLAVDKKLYADLGKAVQLFQGLQEGGQVSPLQVEAAISSYLNAKNAVLVDLQNVTNAVDQFKLVLGCPANLPLILDDTAARPVTRQFDRYYEVIADAEGAFKQIEKLDQLPPGDLRPALQKIYTNDIVVQATEFQKTVLPVWSGVAKLNDNEIKTRMEKLGELRQQLLDEKTDLELKAQPLPEDYIRRLRAADFEFDMAGLEREIRRYEAKPWDNLPKEEQKRLERAKFFRLIAYQAEAVLVWARNDRFERVGQNWPKVAGAPLEDVDLATEDVDKAQEIAVKTALANRWDLMNARSQVVDAWRQLAVTANALLGVLNVGYDLQSQTPTTGSNPLAFSSAGTSQQLSLNFQLPLVRVVQRNNYRTAQINYQQARRNLMVLEDNIAANVRFDVRQLQLFGNNYKIQKPVMQSLYKQVESAREVLVAPADPDSLKASGNTLAGTQAALTNQYLNALSSLNSAQTKMYDVWLSYIATRMQLYQDLEMLPLDSRGVWTDEFGNTAERTNTQTLPNPRPVVGADSGPGQPAQPTVNAQPAPNGFK